MSNGTSWILDSDPPREHVIAFLKQLDPTKGKPLRVTIGPHEESRRAKQNARYWALLTRIAQGMPSHMDGAYHTPEVWHEFHKKQFLGVEGVEIDGTLTHVTKSTRKLKVKEFNDYMTQVEAWAAEHEIWLDNWQG